MVCLIFFFTSDNALTDAITHMRTLSMCWFAAPRALAAGCKVPASFFSHAYMGFLMPESKFNLALRNGARHPFIF